MTIIEPAELLKSIIDGKFLFIAEILGLCDSYSLSSREFYFDRSPRIFENILGLYRKGELHLTESVCPRDFLGELEYWGLSALHLGNFLTKGTLLILLDLRLTLIILDPNKHFWSKSWRGGRGHCIWSKLIKTYDSAGSCDPQSHSLCKLPSSKHTIVLS